ncbi:MAG: hypothetical protein J7J43_04870 [Thermosipho sp. (in: Bacteria)]|nr:hypothetical protein [Thermosipho sp. (in: thermotogales)]
MIDVLCKSNGKISLTISSGISTSNSFSIVKTRSITSAFLSSLTSEVSISYIKRQIISLTIFFPFFIYGSFSLSNKSSSFVFGKRSKSKNISPIVALMQIVVIL